MDTKDDIEVEEMEKVAKEESFERGELIMSIAEKLREEGMEKGIKKGIEKGIEKGKEEGKLEERKELIIEILNQRFGKEFDKELEEKIKKANEEEINKIKKNILKITIDELKDILEWNHKTS